MGRQASWCRSISSSGVRWPAVRSWRSRSGAAGPKIPVARSSPVAGGAVSPGGTMDAGLGVQQLKEIAEGDVGEHAALGGHHDRGPLQRVVAGRGGRGHARIAVAYRPQPCESFGCRGLRPWRGQGRRAGSRPPPARPARAARRQRRSPRSVPLPARRRRRAPGMSRLPGHRAGSCHQLIPASSAPLASQRCCQLPPSWPSSQSSSTTCPRMAPARGTAAQQMLCTWSRPHRVAGQSAAGGRGGKRVRAAR